MKAGKEKKMHLAVFDTNVWLAGLNYTGASYQCLQAVRWGQVQLVHEGINPPSVSHHNLYVYAIINE